MRVLGLLCACLLWATTALAEPQRIALVVGNSAYNTITTLDNPGADANLMADTLTAEGFAVTLILDADQATLQTAIAGFGRDLRAADADAIGLFFYAGHAVQSFGMNYLLPTDTALADAADLSLVGVPAEAVLRQMFSAKNQTNIVILDACRDNPFQTLTDMHDNGLAEMKAPTGTMLSYSTAPGAVAYDGPTGNSPFTAAMARHMETPGLAIEQLFKKVRLDVLEETGGAQTPWESSSMTVDFVFSQTPVMTEEERQWEAVRTTSDALKLQLFLNAYPQSQFADQARALLSPLAVPQVTSDVVFDTPFPENAGLLAGLTFSDVIQMGPAAPPIDGLPKAIWEDQACTSCHAWSRDDLCTQAGTYTNPGNQASLGKPHPFGGSFKRHLQSWGYNNCR